MVAIGGGTIRKIPKGTLSAMQKKCQEPSYVNFFPKFMLEYFNYYINVEFLKLTKDALYLVAEHIIISLNIADPCRRV